MKINTIFVMLAIEFTVYKKILNKMVILLNKQLRTFLLKIWRCDRSTLGIFVYSPHFDARLDFLDKSHYDAV